LTQGRVESMIFLNCALTFPVERMQYLVIRLNGNKRGSLHKCMHKNEKMVLCKEARDQSKK